MERSPPPRIRPPRDEGRPWAPLVIASSEAAPQGSVTFAMKTSSSGWPMLLRFRVSAQFG
jgi:hypothetical protein